MERRLVTYTKLVHSDDGKSHIVPISAYFLGFTPYKVKDAFGRDGGGAFLEFEEGVVKDVSIGDISFKEEPLHHKDILEAALAFLKADIEFSEHPETLIRCRSSLKNINEEWNALLANLENAQDEFLKICNESGLLK